MQSWISWITPSQQIWMNINLIFILNYSITTNIDECKFDIHIELLHHNKYWWISTWCAFNRPLDSFRTWGLPTLSWKEYLWSPRIGVPRPRPKWARIWKQWGPIFRTLFSRKLIFHGIFTEIWRKNDFSKLYSAEKLHFSPTILGGKIPRNFTRNFPQTLPLLN
jgi:hypothetical protein